MAADDREVFLKQVTPLFLPFFSLMCFDVLRRLELRGIRHDPVDRLCVVIVMELMNRVDVSSDNRVCAPPPSPPPVLILCTLLVIL